MGSLRTPSPRARRALRAFGIGLSGLFALVLLLAAAAILLLQSERTATSLARFALGKVSVYPSATLEVDALRVHPSGLVEMRGARLVEGDTLRVAAFDGLRARVALGDLVRGEIAVDSLEVDGPTCHLGALLRGLGSRPPGAPKSGGGRPPSVAVGSVRVRDGVLEVPLALRGRPATLAARDVAIRAVGFRTLPSLALQLDMLTAQLALPGMPRPAALRARGSLRDRRATLDTLTLDTAASHVMLRGTAAVLDGLNRLLGDLDLALEAEPLDAVDLEPFFAIPPEGGGLHASVRAHLEGGTARHASGTTALAIRDARWGAHRVPAADLNVQWTDGAAAIDARMHADGRVLAVRGTARPFDPTVPFDLDIALPVGRVALRGDVARHDGPRYRIAEARFERVDLSALAARAPATSLTGTLAAEGSGVEPRTGSADATLELEPSTVGALALEGATLQARLRGGAVTLAADAHAHGANVHVATRARPFGSPVAVDSVVVRFAHLDLARWAPATDLATDLSGTLALEPPGVELGRGRARARLDLAPSRCGDQSLAGGTLYLRLDGEQVTGRGDVRFVEGGLQIEASAWPFGSPMRYEIRGLEFTALDVGALLGKPQARTHLSGVLALAGSGTAADSARVHATLDLAPSTAHGAAIDTLHADAGYDAGDVQLAAAARVPGGDVDVEASGRLRGEAPTYRAHGALRLNDLGRILRRSLPASSAAIEFHAEGRGLDRRSARIAATLAANGHVGAVRVDSLASAFRLVSDTLCVDTLRVRANVARVDVAGRLRLPATLPAAGDELHVAARVLDASPLAPLLGQDTLAVASGSAEAFLRGIEGGAAFDVRAGLRGVTSGAMSAAGLQAFAQGTLGADRRFMRANAQASLDTLRAPWASVLHAAVSADHDGESVQARAQVAFDDTTRLRLTAHGAARVPGEGVLDTLALQAGRNAWALAHPVDVAYGRRFAVRDLRLSSGTQRLEVDGALDRDGQQSLVARVDSLRLEILSRILRRSRIAGRLDGEVRVMGPAASPRTEGRFALGLRAPNAAVLGVDGRFLLADSALTLDARLQSPEGDGLTVAGRMPFGRRDSTAAGARGAAQRAAPVELRVHADGFSLGALEALVPPSAATDVAGRLWVDAELAGTVAAPRLRGTLRLESGAVRVPALGPIYRDIGLDAALEGTTLQLARLEAKADRGTLRATGRIDLGSGRDGALALHAEFDRFRALRNRRLVVETSGTLDLGGTCGAPTVQGKLTLTDTDIDVSGGAQGAQAVDLTEADLKMLEENFGIRLQTGPPASARLLENATLGVVVQADRDTWLRRRATPRLALELSGSVDVRKQPHAPLQIFGRMESLPQRSYAEQLGRRFDVDNGSVTLNGDPMAAQIDFKATHEIPGVDRSQASAVTITLKGRGTPDNLKLTFESDPAMDEASILSYLATGRASGASGATLSTADATSTATAVAIGQASAIVEELGSSLGLDVVQVRNDATRGTTLVAGNYVNEKTYLGLRQSATFSTEQNSSTSTGALTEVEVEYELLKWLLVNLQGGVGDIRLMFRSRYAY